MRGFVLAAGHSVGKKLFGEIINPKSRAGQQVPIGAQILVS